MNYYELNIRISKSNKDFLIRRLTDEGCLGMIEQNDYLVAYFPDTIDIKAITEDLSIMHALFVKSGQIGELTFHHKLIPDRDWNESWKKGFHPINVGTQFTILPSWESERAGRINIIIDPAMAFGTGHHETTRSCLVLMEKYVGHAGHESFLDIGTGTGILAIAAAKLGYRRVTAVDTDILALDATRLNIGLNHTQTVEVYEGSISNLNETYDFITANIISGVLVLIAPAIATHLKQAGFAVLSGILEEQVEEVIEAMTQAGFTIVERYPDGRWVSFVTTH